MRLSRRAEKARAACRAATVFWVCLDAAGGMGHPSRVFVLGRWTKLREASKHLARLRRLGLAEGAKRDGVLFFAYLQKATVYTPAMRAAYGHFGHTVRL